MGTHMSNFYKVAEKTFEAELVYEGSWGSRDAGKHVSTMTLYFNKNNTGFIEWDIPALDDVENIDLTFELDLYGKRTLTDYDGVFSLPKEAVELLRENGIIVTEEFE